MKSTSLFILLFIILFSFSCGKKNGERLASVGFITHEADKRLDVLFDGKLFTSFCWPENVYKPILYPVYTSSGTEVTRGFPLKPRVGEQVDHLHQVGIWLNFGNVNGLDFWGNGYRGVKEPKGGEIRHVKIERLASKNGVGSFVSAEEWLDPSGKKILTEKTEYQFSSKGSTRIIDRITTLKAGDSAVVFKDTKEGMLGIRVARQLELPSRQAVVLIDNTGKPSAEKDSLNTGVTGNYLSSEGISGEAVWGTRAKWMDLYGLIGNEKVSLVICDHPKNPGYPTYWHARGYGLFSANPLGWNDFTKGKESFNFIIQKEKSVKFRYRVIISSGVHLTDSEINTMTNEFSKKYK